jgi:hypothetical protein
VSEKTTKAKRRKISMAAIVANMKGGSTWLTLSLTTYIDA